MENKPRAQFQVTVKQFWQLIRSKIRITRRHPLVVFPFFVATIASFVFAIKTKTFDIYAYGWPATVWDWAVLVWTILVVLISFYSVYGWSVRALRKRVLVPVFQFYSGIFIVTSAGYTIYLAWTHYQEWFASASGIPGLYTMFALSISSIGIHLIGEAIYNPVFSPSELRRQEERTLEEEERRRKIYTRETDTEREHDFDVMMTKKRGPLNW